jgi:hypothetical protein
MSDMAVPAQQVPRLRAAFYHDLGEEFCRMAFLHATREPDALRGAIEESMTRIADLRARLDEVGWSTPSAERDQRVTVSSATQRATRTRIRLMSDSLFSSLRDGKLTIEQAPVGDA